MSIKSITRVLDHCSLAAPSGRLTLIVLAEYADDDGYAWPSVPSIARRTMLSPRHQTRVLTSLVEAGELYIDAGTGRGNTNAYVVLSGRTEAEIVEILVRRCRLSVPVATDVAASALANRPQNPDTHDTLSDVNPDTHDTLSERKPDAHDTLSDSVKADTHVQKDDIPAQRVTSRHKKGDTHVTRTVIEPSERTVSEPSEEEGATAALSPVLAIYQETFRRTLDASERTYFDKALPHPDPDRWREVCKLWVERGWQPHLLSGMVDRYHRTAPARASPTHLPVAPAPPPAVGIIELEAIDF